MKKKNRLRCIEKNYLRRILENKANILENHANILENHANIVYYLKKKKRNRQGNLIFVGTFFLLSAGHISY